MSVEHGVKVDRRTFCLSSMAASMLAVAVGEKSMASTGAGDASALALDFAKAKRDDPRLIAFDNAVALDVVQPRIEGKIPSGLEGSFFRNGPALFERLGVRYRHWFDGDGLLQRWTIGSAGVQYRSRFVGTRKHRLEEEAGKFLLPTSGGGMPLLASATGADSVNPSNTSVIAVNGEMWALWEGGSPFRVTPNELESRGYVDLGDAAKGAPFSAHPRVGADGRMWNIGSLGSRVILYRLDRFGKLQHLKVQPLGQEGYYHDFLLTQRSIVLVQCSTASDGKSSIENGTFGSIRGVSGKPMRVHVFDRETFELVRQAELPGGFAFHFGNGWEEADGTICFDICHDANGDAMLEFFKPMRGAFPNWQAGSYRVTLPKTGAARFERLHARVEFPKVNPKFDTIRNRYVYASCINDPARTDWFDSVVKLDLENGKSQTFHYGADWMVEEHVFVPKAGALKEDDGWLVGTALNWKTQQSALTIFDASRPERKFLARAWLDSPVPLGLHGTFVGVTT
jgi:carotenoid cleavage dioxygenase-like enzyme